jgi:4a-hydroxytetrahydrobiopterin dehydratase
MLSTKKCKPCESDATALKRQEVKNLLKIINSGWSVINNAKISRVFQFKTFSKAISFINHIARIAEQEGHHPDIHNYYNKVVVELSTHSINGLSKNDFTLAQKIDQIIC